ncbi:uncharacterized protein PAC_12069 [Phialocephala subalpina]|uniref:Protein kinase domain-containing protein n=1 Tax=Phialocephala subalpina TaxID=576137 RepID=A0A1L7XAX7_9HELO|nr:uncharacterized protein PAC_12069 [Phialocephala subalpina]
MANMNKPHACLFDGVEDVEAGYVLITVIKHGTQGQACIVRSLTDGNVYVRKRLVKRSEHLATEELSFSDLIPASMTPEIVQHFDGETKAPTLIYAFCNGGDLSAFIKKCCKNDKVIPEAVFWHIEKQLIEIIACIHSGWQNDVGFQEDWQLITHSDIHYGNVFLHWSDEDSPFPQFLLGDWGVSPKTKPEAPKDFEQFGGAEETPIQTLRKYEKDVKTKVIETWEWIDIDDLPSQLFEEVTPKSKYPAKPKTTRKGKVEIKPKSAPKAKPAATAVKLKVKEASRVTKKPKSSTVKSTRQKRKAKESEKEKGVQLRRSKRITKLV